MLGSSIASLFVLAFVVDVAADIAGLQPADDVLQGAALLAAASILASGVGFATPERTETP